jgi:hypothetical protein
VGEPVSFGGVAMSAGDEEMTFEAPALGAPVTTEQRVEYLRGCLRDPDGELMEALMAEREAILAVLGVGQ